MPTNTVPITCQKGEPLMKLAQGIAPELNYQLPVATVFETRGIITIPLF
jgi:hypothetical protein